jgi:hypothetical protein
MPEWEINCNNCLVISDIHQDINWVKSILEVEKGNYDHLHFNGDIIDSHKKPDKISGARETAIFYRWLLDNGTVNLGNHDLPYMEFFPYNLKYKDKPFGAASYCSGFSESKSLKFNKEMTWGAWRKAKTFRVINGWLVSHAGFHLGFWDWSANDNDNLKRLWETSEEWLEKLPYFYNKELFGLGKARGGDAYMGGPFWLDFHYEFKDSIPMKQLVGHTGCADAVRYQGNSCCIDGHQTFYAIINKEGGITFKGMHNGKPFIPQIVKWQQPV